MTRLATAALLFCIAVALRSEARACTPILGLRLFAARATGPQPRNTAVLVLTVSRGTPSFDAVDTAGKPVALQATPLRSSGSPDHIHLVREAVAPAPGSKRVYRGALESGSPFTTELTLEFGDELDVTPPRLEGTIRMWVDRGHSPGVCPGIPTYVTGVRLPPASERAFVTIFETDRDGRSERPLIEAFVSPETADETRLAISGEVGRPVCLAFRTTDLAGNATPLGAPCCADEQSATGACERVSPPPRITGTSNGHDPPPADAGATPSTDAASAPSRGGSGCSLSAGRRAGASWLWGGVAIGLLAISRSPRPRPPGSGRCGGRGCGSSARRRAG